jgi:predicted ATPase
MSAAIRQGLREPDQTEQLATETLALATANRFSYWIAWGTILRGWAIATQAAVGEGLKILKEGLSAYRSTGAELFRPYSLVLLAEICGKAGDPAEGMRCINEAIENGAANDVHFFDAELFRIEAWLYALSSSGRHLVVETLELAAKAASRQGAKNLELRVQNDLLDVLGANRGG